MTTETLPTIQEELDRKIVDHLFFLEEQHNRKSITGSEFRAAVRAIFSCASGLMSEQVAGLVTFADDSVPAIGRTSTSVFLKAKTVIVASVDLKDGGVTILTSTGNQLAKHVDHGAADDPVVAGHTTIRNFADRLKTDGYVQLLGEIA